MFGNSEVNLESQNQEIALMEKWIMSQLPLVINNLEMITTPGVLYHISPSDDIKEFVPRTMTRTMSGEDLSVPRVCTGATLIDAMRGYGVLPQDYLSGTGLFDDKSKWRGGYYIYEIPYSVCLVPGVPLNPMARNTDERWLVDYRHPKQKYPARIIGKFYSTGLIQNRESVERKERDEKEVHKLYRETNQLEIHLEVYPKAVIDFDIRTQLKGGTYHKFILDSIARYDGPFGPDRYEHRPLSSAQYLESKKSCAELLSFNPGRLYSDW